MSGSMEGDYWFLRENGVSVLTTLKMLGMAYYKKKEERNGKNECR